MTTIENIFLGTSFLITSYLVAPNFCQAQSKTHTLAIGPKNAKNIIFLIGDGMGVAQITAGLTAKKDALNLERFKIMGLSKTQSSDNYVTDSGAGATAFSIGQRTYNGAIGVDSLGIAKPTILEIASKAGKATGMVVTCSITHATPASFIAHQASRNLDEEIALDFLNTDFDVIIGGGRQFFTHRKDHKNLYTDFAKKGYQLPETMTALAKIKTGKVVALIAEDTITRYSNNRGPMLQDATLKAIEILNQNPKGFFLMVEGSQIDWGGHIQNSDYVVAEMVDFDNVVGKVLDFAIKDGNTLVVVTADHETGGYALTGGNMRTGQVTGKFIYGKHTAEMVPVFAYGPTAQQFSGIQTNYSFFGKFMKAFGFKAPVKQ